MFLITLVTAPCWFGCTSVSVENVFFYCDNQRSWSRGSVCFSIAQSPFPFVIGWKTSAGIRWVHVIYMKGHSSIESHRRDVILLVVNIMLKGAVLSKYRLCISSVFPWKTCVLYHFPRVDWGTRASLHPDRRNEHLQSHSNVGTWRQQWGRGGMYGVVLMIVFFFKLFWLSNCQINWCAICYCVVSCHSHGNPRPPVMEMQVRSELTFSDYLLWAEPRSTTQWRDGVSSAWWTNGSENRFKIIISSSRIWKDKHQLCRFIVCEVRKFAFLIPGFSNQGLRNRPYQQDHFKNVFFFFYQF